jgi:hypothetical protein
MAMSKEEQRASSEPKILRQLKLANANLGNVNSGILVRQSELVVLREKQAFFQGRVDRLKAEWERYQSAQGVARR